MPAMLILAVVAMGLVLAVLGVVVVGIRQEPSSQELPGQAPRLMAKITRRLVGVYVRRPDPSVIPVKRPASVRPTPLANAPAAADANASANRNDA
jgi:hypothetical protein